MFKRKTLEERVTDLEAQVGTPKNTCRCVICCSLMHKYKRIEVEAEIYGDTCTIAFPISVGQEQWCSDCITRVLHKGKVTVS